MKTYWRLLSYLRPYWFRLLCAVFCIVMYSLLDGISMSLALPLLNVLFAPGKVAETVPKVPSADILSSFRRLLEAIQDRILEGGPMEVLSKIVFLIVLVFLLKNLFDYSQRYLSASLEQLAIRDLRNEIYNHLHDLSFHFFHRTKTGQLISSMTNDVNLVRSVFTDSFSKVLISFFLVAVYLGMLFIMSWKLTLMSFVLIPPMALLVSWVARKLRRKNLRLQNIMGEITSTFQETISGIRVVKAFSMENFERRKFGQQTDSYYKQFMRTNLYSALCSPLSELLMTLVGGALLLYGGRQVLAGEMHANAFLVFLLVCLRIMSPVKVFGNFNDILQRGLSGCDRIFSILDTPPRIVDRPGARSKKSFERSIRFEHVSYGYNDHTRVLQDVSLEIFKGEAMAIVGPSGVGKSTLVDLIPRFYDIQEGRIAIDGEDIRDLRIADLRGLVGIVTQEIILFNDTVRNNIAYGLQEMPLERVIEAARAANAHEFIQNLEHGYDTSIGDRGILLSGGQRQRISIARALLKNPEILIFDEATSSLDTESEMLVQQAIERLMQGRTSMVIAHRLSTIQHCQRIVVMDDGRIVESGSHEELMLSGGLYKRLYQLQFKLNSGQ